MSVTVLSQINQLFYQLPDAERRIAECVIADPVRVQYLSITELSELAGVGDATVTRFCRRLGLAGFYAFKLELAKAASEAPAPTPDNGVQTALQDAMGALNATAKSLSDEVLHRAAERLLHARRVLCAGAGGSLLIAAECAHLFTTVCTKFFALPDTHMQLMALSGMEKGDVLLLFSYSGATKSGAELIEYAKRRGVHVLLVSGFAHSPLGEQCDAVLQCAAHEGPFQSGSMPARMAQLLAIDTLFRTYCSIDKTVTQHAERIAEALSDQHL